LLSHLGAPTLPSSGNDAGGLIMRPAGWPSSTVSKGCLMRRALDAGLSGSFFLLPLALAAAPAISANERPRGESERHYAERPHGREPVITFAGADLEQELLFIAGRNLGPGRVRVRLGSEWLVVDSAGSDWILARLPEDVSPGSYRLEVVRVPHRRRREGRRSASFEVTIGAVGPAGPPGDTGPQGPAGPPGHLGLAGLGCPAGQFVSAFGADGALVCASPGAPGAVCGNGVLEAGEQCDDGNVASGDGCDAACRLEGPDGDDDGDGWTRSEGDCCDVVGPGCSNPELVNPGAFDVPGNSVDDDCDGDIDNRTVCDGELASDETDAMLYAAAMDLCRTTDESTADPRLWGVISAELTLAGGAGLPAPESRSIRSQFGSGNPARFGDRLVVLSTGHAAAEGDSSPAFEPFQGGMDKGTTSQLPADWLAANGGAIPTAVGCPPAPNLVAIDSVMLKFRIRTPSNARSFSVRTRFFSSEYPEWVCNAYNDYFVALLDSGHAGQPSNPIDKNVALYTDPAGTQYPVGVNLAFGGTGLFRACLNGPTGCGAGSVAGTTSTCTGTAGLAGTGFDIVDPPAQFPGDPGVCPPSNLAGGGTGWLRTSGNVLPGEVIELRLAIWDTGDPWYDSVVLLDDFQWSEESTQPGSDLD